MAISDAADARRVRSEMKKSMRRKPLFALVLFVHCSSGLKPSVLCIGECLFDGLPAGIFLGGAPLNAAVHLQQRGVNAAFASAVGSDRLGREAARRLRSRDVDVSLLKVVDETETGFVEVDIDEKGDASYTFNDPAAWDFCSPAGIAEAAAQADAVVYGTLGQRAQMTRAAISAASDASSYAVCDINLRPPYDGAEMVAAAVDGVDLLKLNDEELLPVAESLRSTAQGDDGKRWRADAACAAASDAEAARTAVSVAAAAAAIGRASSASTVVVTRGAEGAVLWDEASPDEAWSCDGFAPPGAAVVDSVGAGDGFLAAFLASKLQGGSAAESLEAGCRVGAYVAGQSGATPRLDDLQIAALAANAQPAVGRVRLTA